MPPHPGQPARALRISDGGLVLRRTGLPRRVPAPVAHDTVPPSRELLLPEIVTSTACLAARIPDVWSVSPRLGGTGRCPPRCENPGDFRGRGHRGGVANEWAPPPNGVLGVATAGTGGDCGCAATEDRATGWPPPFPQRRDRRRWSRVTRPHSRSGTSGKPAGDQRVSLTSRRAGSRSSLADASGYHGRASEGSVFNSPAGWPNGPSCRRTCRPP